MCKYHANKSAARIEGYEVVILLSPHITLNNSPLKPANTLPMTKMGDDHDCTMVINTSTPPRPDLMQTPIQDPDFILYTDGSASRPSDNTHLSGYAVVTDWDMLEAAPLPRGTFARVAELYALMRACVLAKDGPAIYTDSGYALKQLMVLHEFGREFGEGSILTSCGKSIKYHQSIRDLLDAIMLFSDCRMWSSH